VQGLKPAKTPVPAQYQNPANPSEQWSGRGRKPRWLKELLDSGKTLDQFQIA
jgi:DNA-binding protein H-NS